MDIDQESRIQRNGNIVEITKPEGNYRIVYKTHYITHGVNLVPVKADGFFLETGTPEDYVSHPLRTLNEFLQWKPHRPMFDALAKRHIPIYMADVSFKNTRRTLAVMGAEFIIEGAEVFGAFHFIEQAIAEQNMLKLAALAPVLVWAWSTVALRGAAFTTSISEGWHNVVAQMWKLNFRIHPEIAPLTLNTRNLIIAHKEQWLADYLGSHPHFTTLLGPDHIRIEDALAELPEKRLEKIKRLRPLWERITTPETIYYSKIRLQKKKMAS